jgi:hypothetical protein
LSSYTNTVATLDALNLWTDANDLTDDFVAHAERCVAKASSDGVNIAIADTAAFIHDVNIVILEDLWGELWKR